MYKVEETSDYDQFSFMKGNRVVIQRHLNDLIKN